MSDEMHLLVYTFDSADEARSARTALEALDRQLGEQRGHFAVVKRAADGAISLREPNDLRSEIAEIAASVAGGVTWFLYTFVGLMGTPPAFMAEQAADGTAHRLVRDSGFPDQALYEIGTALDAGDAAVVALVPESERTELVAELERQGGQVWSHPLPPAVVAELHAGAPPEA
jgi:uncharacterized membrane protein